MNNLIISVFFFFSVFFSSVSFAQGNKSLPGDFNHDGVVDDFEEEALAKGTEPGHEYKNLQEPSVSHSPVEIIVDYSQEKGKFSKYLFGADLEADDNSFKLSKEAGFRVACSIQFNNEDIRHFGTMEQKMALYDKYNMEGVLYLEKEGKKPLTQEQMQLQLDTILDKINSLQSKYPNAKINAFLFGNEPDFPFAAFNAPSEDWHWQGTQEQFFQNYEMFARYMKSKNKHYIVGTPGFAPASFSISLKPSDWPEKLIQYAFEHNVPLDFISFHSYSSEIKNDISDLIDKLNSLLDKYPVKSEIFGRPVIACNEFDIRAQIVTDTTYYKVFDTAWRASHNILAEMAMIDKGVWLVNEWAGPVQFADKNVLNDISMAWIKKDGTIKPVYYGHKLLNTLADNIRLAQSGGNFQTFGAIAGRSADGKIINIVMANYYQDLVFKEYANELAEQRGIFRQAEGLPLYKEYKITIKGLPACEGKTLRIEKYLVDDKHNGELVETTSIPCSQEISVEGRTGAPDVQLIRIIMEQ